MVTLQVTELKVSPSDWLTNPSSINKSWQIWYRFNGILVKVQGMNRHKEYTERLKKTLELLQQEKEKLSVYGYNPLTKTFLKTPPNKEMQVPEFHKAHRGVGFLEALHLAYDQLQVEKPTLACVKSCLKYVSASSIKIGLKNLPINQIRRKHIKLLMNHCSEQRNFSPRSWNIYRSYLMMLFEQLDELEMVDHNPAKELKKKKEILQLRDTLSQDERVKVKTHLVKNYPDFYRFVEIFFHSGSRRTELLSLKVKDVNLEKGEYKTLVKKGNQKRFVIRVIKNVVKSLWIEQLREANPEHYVFSIGLSTGTNKIRPEQVTKRWKRLVKDKLGITADLYSLKHLNTDETASLLDIDAAAAHNGHTTTQVTKRHYAFGEDERVRQRLKLLENEF
jgi:site-specific recombinase XerC